MKPSPGRDFTVGIFVLIGLLSIVYLSVNLGGLSYTGSGGLTLYAAFDEVGGLRVRSAVAIGGVKVGQVKAVDLDDVMRARVTLDLDAGLELPTDTSAGIRTSGLLGDQFIALEPGAEEDLLQPGDEIAFTESAMILERLIGQMVHNAGLDGDE